MVKVVATTIAKKSHQFELEPTTTMGQIKDLIAKAEGKERESIALCYKSKMLKNNSETLEDVKYEEGTHFVIILMKSPIKSFVKETKDDSNTSRIEKIEYEPKEIVEPNQSNAAINEELVIDLKNQGYEEDRIRDALQKSNNDKEKALNELKGNPFDGFDVFQPNSNAKQQEGDQFPIDIEITSEEMEELIDEIEEEDPDLAERMRADPQLVKNYILETLQIADEVDLNAEFGKNLSPEEIEQLIQSGALTQEEINAFLNENEAMSEEEIEDDLMEQDEDLMEDDESEEDDDNTKLPKKPRIEEEKTSKKDSLTEQDKKNIEDLMELGFPRSIATEAYIVSNKNKDVAANYLFERGY